MADTATNGLKVQAELDQGHYPTGVNVSDKELALVPLARDAFHGYWNYIAHPEPPK